LRIRIVEELREHGHNRLSRLMSLAQIVDSGIPIEGGALLGLLQQARGLVGLGQARRCQYEHE
jgi:hypothetical protein